MRPKETIEDLLSSKPDVMSGRTVFRGTRVPFETVIVNLNSGRTLDEILDDFPTLDREDVVALLQCFDDAVLRAKMT